MTPLSPKRRAFIDEMQQSKEAAEYGFELLSKRKDGVEFLDALMSADLLSARNNPAPVPAKQDNSFYIPYWRALDYVESVVKFASETGDASTVNKVVQVILAISRGTNDPRGPQDNFHTRRKLTDIVASLPDAALSTELIGEIASWIAGRFDHGMVVHVLGDRLLPRLIGSNFPGHGSLALMLFDFVSQIQWPDTKDKEDPDPIPIAEDFWLAKLFESNAAEAGRKLGRPIIALLRRRLRDIYGRGTRAKASWLFRAAVELHPQNHSWRNIDNIFIDALRDALIAGFESANANELDAEVADMYLNGSSIERRVSVYVVAEKFDRLGDKFQKYLDKRMFEDECLHESYKLLEHRFESLHGDIQAKVYQYVASLTQVETNDEEMSRLLRKQRRWLSAIHGKGYPAADDLYSQVIAKVGPPPANPDLHSYMTSWSGPGPSAYTVDELLLFLRDGSLVTRLNNFETKDKWNGPTERALVNTFEQAIKQNPSEFLSASRQFLSVRRSYQYGLLKAFNDLWIAENAKPSDIEWGQIWRSLFEWSNALLDETFWREPTPERDTDLTPTRDWIPPLIAEFIKAGTRDDSHSFDPALLPQAFGLLSTILDHLPISSEDPGRDPMQDAINVARGRVIDSFFNLALRWCRVSDKASGEHRAIWAKLSDRFSTELSHANGANFQFTTLAANYCAHLHYLSPEWFEENYKNIISPPSDASFRCAISGLAYAAASNLVYDRLRKVGAIERALALKGLPEYGRERMLERIALAYLWKQETIESNYFASLFVLGREEDLATIVSFFWSVNNQELSEEQTLLILTFWRRASKWALEQEPINNLLLSRLAKLTCFLSELGEEDTALLIRLAPMANAEHLSYFFSKELDRLAERFPAQVAKIALAYLRSTGPEYDFEDRWLQITKKIASAKLNLEALELAEIMSGQPGFDEIYRSI